MSEQRLRVNSENVVFEEVDGEVIAIDLGGGAYYSIGGSGTAIWALLAGGASADEICAALVARFDADAEAVRAEVEGLLSTLLESGLVVAAPEANGPPALAGNDEGKPFESPRFERYTDMKDYFLLDPIHEVDTTGWPRPAA